MKPLVSESNENNSLQALGRASVQIVHDLKNQLNGLKLYATFLRKRLEKTERPGDELETVNKLIGGLDRTASDLSVLVEFGRPLDLKRQAGVDLNVIVQNVGASISKRPPASGPLSAGISINCESNKLVGEFDATSLFEALRSISAGALKMVNRTPDSHLKILVKRESLVSDQTGVVEWHGLNGLDHDPFRSFAGSDEIRMALAAKVIEAHGGSAERHYSSLRVSLPLSE